MRSRRANVKAAAGCLFPLLVAACAASPHLATRALSADGNAPRLLTLPPAYPSGASASSGGGGTFECSIQTTGRATDCTTVTADGDPAFSSAALRWLSDEARFSPLPQQIRNDFAIRFGIGHAFGAAGGSIFSEWPHPFPAYPVDYADTGRNGFVRATFKVTAEGRAIDAALQVVQGGDAFGQAVLTYLQSETTRFRPDFFAGQPTLSPGRSFDIHFNGPPRQG